MSLDNYFQQCLSVVCSTSLGFVEKSWHVNFFFKMRFTALKAVRESYREYTISISSSITGQTNWWEASRDFLCQYSMNPLKCCPLPLSTHAQASVVTLRDSVDICCVTYPGHCHRYFYAWTEREVGTPCNPRTRSKTSRRTIRTSNH